MTYIDPRGKVFAHLARLAAWQAGERPGPVTVEWDLSNRCTLGCMDCHFAYTHVRGPWAKRPRTLPLAGERTGDLADVGLVRRALAEAKALGAKSLVWSGGGEPTTHPYWVEAIAEAHRLGYAQGMYTLGGLLTPTTGVFLATRADWVVVSLDAPDDQTYAAEKGVPPARFDAALDGIRSLVGHQAAVGVSFLLHAGNWVRADEMVALARTLGATYTLLRPSVQFSPAAPGTLTGDRSWVSLVLPILRRLAAEPDVEVDPERFVRFRDWTAHPYAACYGIRLSTTVTPDGRVWICPNRRGYAKSCLGDLRTESFAAIWARHPGQWTDFRECRAMCRLFAVNEELAAVYAPRQHEEFV